jgi:hypothetical protein
VVATLTLRPAILALDLMFKQGADASVLLTTVDANGAAITDPTGYTARAQIRSNPTGIVLFEWNTAPTPAQGRAVLTYSGTTQLSTLTLSLTGAQSALFVFGTAYWDCFLFSPSNQDACLAEGTVTVDPRYTY